MTSKPCYQSLIFVSALLFLLCACQQNPQPTAKAPGAEEALRDAVDAYIYGYPLVTMDMTRKQLTNVATPQASRVLRLYWPKETPPSIIDGTWKPPAIKKVQ